MKSIQLKNFQCFADSEEIPLHDFTIFIGENDSGKSAILRALDIFYGNSQITLDIFHRINNEIQNECEIQIKYNDIHKNEETFPKQFVINNEVTIKKRFSLNDSNQIEQIILIKAYNFSQEELNNVSALKADSLKKIFKEFDLNYTNVDESKRTLNEYLQNNFDNLQKSIDWQKVNWNNISSYLPIYEYYNSSSYGNPVHLVSNTLKSVFRSFFYDINEHNQEILKPELSTKKEIIENELNTKIQNELKQKIQHINKKISNITGDFSIDFGSGFQLSSLQADFGQGLRDINYIGEGSKKRLFLAITEWDKEIRSKKEYKKVIRGYDEPDTSLHYKAQKEMYYTLKELSENGNVRIQPILCTHSLSMIDRAPPKIINHVIIEHGISHIDYLKGEDDEDIKNFLENISSISGITNSSLFFERCFLIVEGETEYNALPKLYKKMTSKNLSEDGVILVNIEGNGSWKSFLKLLNRNKQKATILYLDKDIQEDGKRNLTPQTIREVGFDQNFIEDNVIFVGTKEFEDVFTNEIIAKYLNQFHPKIGEEQWCCDDIENLRGKGKFSDKIKNLVGSYQHENGIRHRDFKKPEFGMNIAEILTKDEIKDLKIMDDLMDKINKIVE